MLFKKLLLIYYPIVSLYLTFGWPGNLFFGLHQVIRSSQETSYRIAEGFFYNILRALRKLRCRQATDYFSCIGLGYTIFGQEHTYAVILSIASRLFRLNQT